MTRVMRVVECSDSKYIYGFLEIEDVTVSEVQQKIYEIKNNRTFKEEYPDWTIDDVFSKFPKEWKWNFVADDDCVVEI